VDFWQYIIKSSWVYLLKHRRSCSVRTLLASNNSKFGSWFVWIHLSRRFRLPWIIRWNRQNLSKLRNALLYIYDRWRPQCLHAIFLFNHRILIVYFNIQLRINNWRHRRNFLSHWSINILDWKYSWSLILILSCLFVLIFLLLLNQIGMFSLFLAWRLYYLLGLS
jgi:hypothetical protein